MVVEGDYETDNFSITISWEESGGVVDEYRIQTNTTTQSNISTITTTVVLEGEYNVPLEIRVSGINCAGSSAEVTEQVIVGMCLHVKCGSHCPCLPQLAVVLPVHQSMAVLVSGPVPE